MSDLLRTPLYDLHVQHGAKMVPFAGYEMPVQYATGVLKEHLHTRAGAGLFDVSHMGQIVLRANSGIYSEVARALEQLVPVDVLGLANMRQRYGFFTNENGGIIDDLMISNRGDHLFLVVNAARKKTDIAHLRSFLGSECSVEVISDRALIALQGPKAQRALARLLPDVAQMRFMDVAVLESVGVTYWISRSGYTGEDGYEISVPSDYAARFAESLLSMTEVEPIGLGARDSLRLEAGLCLYGADLDETTTPVEGSLTWAIQKVRRDGGSRKAGFPGAARVLAELANGPERLRVGLLPAGRAPMRAGTELFAAVTDVEPIGTVTSGAFGPTIERPMSMGFVRTEYARIKTVLYGEVRGKRLPVHVASLPFINTHYRR